MYKVKLTGSTLSDNTPFAEIVAEEVRDATSARDNRSPFKVEEPLRLATEFVSRVPEEATKAVPERGETPLSLNVLSLLSSAWELRAPFPDSIRLLPTVTVELAVSDTVFPPLFIKDPLRVACPSIDNKPTIFNTPPEARVARAAKEVEPELITDSLTLKVAVPDIEDSTPICIEPLASVVPWDTICVLTGTMIDGDALSVPVPVSI